MNQEENVEQTFKNKKHYEVSDADKGYQSSASEQRVSESESAKSLGNTPMDLESNNHDKSAVSWQLHKDFIKSQALSNH